MQDPGLASTVAAQSSHEFMSRHAFQRLAQRFWGLGVESVGSEVEGLGGLGVEGLGLRVEGLRFSS